MLVVEIDPQVKVGSLTWNTKRVKDLCETQYFLQNCLWDRSKDYKKAAQPIKCKNQEYAESRALPLLERLKLDSPLKIVHEPNVYEKTENEKSALYSSSQRRTS